MPVYCLLLLTPFDAIAHCLPCTFLRGFSFFSPSLLGFFFLFRHVLQEVLHTSCTFFFPLSLSLYSSLVTALFSPYIHQNSLRVSNTWIMGRILLLFAPMHLSCCVVSLFKSQNCRGFIVILCELPVRGAVREMKHFGLRWSGRRRRKRGIVGMALGRCFINCWHFYFRRLNGKDGRVIKMDMPLVKLAHYATDV